jgi:hypothetical protein
MTSSCWIWHPATWETVPGGCKKYSAFFWKSAETQKQNPRTFKMKALYPQKRREQITKWRPVQFPKCSALNTSQWKPTDSKYSLTRL